MKRYSKEILGYLYDPKRKYFHVVVELKNEKGALADLAAVLAKAGVNLLSGFTSVEAEGSSGVFSSFAEAEDPSLTVDDIRNVVARSPFAVKSIVKESKNGLLVDNFHFPLQMTPGSNAIIMSVNMLTHMFKGIRDIFGTGGEVILYDEGVSVGRSWMESIVKKTGEEHARAHLNELFQIYHSSGWGMIDVTSISPNLSNAIVRVWNGFECAGQTTTKPFSQFLRGVLNGSYGTLSKTPTRCVETKCVATGDRYCEFSIIAAETSGAG